MINSKSRLSLYALGIPPTYTASENSESLLSVIPHVTDKQVAKDANTTHSFRVIV